MTDSEMYAGLVTTLLDRFAEPIVKGLVNSAKSEWEKFKVDFDIAFRQYLRSDIRTERINKAENSLRHFLLTERGYKLEQKIEVCEYAEDHQVYSLIKETWIGDMIRTMASLRDILEQRRKAEEKDLFCLLTE